MTIDDMIRIKEERGYSIAQLSEYSGVPVGTIQKIFAGISRQPRKATLDALERVLTGDENCYAGRAYSYENKALGNQQPMVSESVSYGKAEKRKYTIADYNAIPDERRVELIDGVIYDMNAPKPVHQCVIGYFHIEIANYIRQNHGPCMVWLSPFDVQLDCDDYTMLEPDLVIVCDETKMRGFGLYGAPDFVLEVLSESTRRKDMFLKSMKYQNAGVREYWIVDPKKSKLIIYNFMDQDMIPEVLPLAGTRGIAIFDGSLEIDLDGLNREIEKYRRFE